MLPTDASIIDELDIITPISCVTCDGAIVSLFMIAQGVCPCSHPMYWSGSDCVAKTECPCIIDHVPYQVGETFSTDKCEECICQIGGLSQCQPKNCPPCPKGQRRKEPGTCNCKCEKCPPETIICPTSGECIPEELWCDGIVHCPDDERNCLVTEEPYVKVERHENISKWNFYL
jgi:von Willebrand factor